MITRMSLKVETPAVSRCVYVGPSAAQKIMALLQFLVYYKCATLLHTDHIKQVPIKIQHPRIKSQLAFNSVKV